MRPPKHPKQGAGEILPPIEEACSSAQDRAPAVDAHVAEPASSPRPEPDLSMPPRLSVPDRQRLLSLEGADRASTLAKEDVKESEIRHRSATSHFLCV